MDAFYKKLNISKEDFLFQYQSHANFPSALAFSDTLNFLGIKNDAYEIPKEDLGELPADFIIIYNNTYGLVNKVGNDYLLYTNKTEKKSEADIFSNSDDFVILFETNENDIQFEIDYSWIKILIFGGLVLFFFQFSWKILLYNMLSIVGVLISMEIFKSKFGNESAAMSAICGNGCSGDSKADDNCDKIISSDGVNILGLKLSDFSLIYFSYVLLLFAFVPKGLFIMKALSYLSFPVIIYSLVYQLFIKKAVCKVCLLIISILIFQLSIAAFVFTFDFDLNSIFTSLLLMMLLFFSIKYINDTLEKKNEYQKQSIKSLRLKKDYTIFKRELTAKHFSLNEKVESFSFGNTNAKLTISLITNPLCGYCKDAHIIFKELLVKYPDISYQIRFNFFEDEKLVQVIYIFKNIFNQKGAKQLLVAIDDWYKFNNLQTFQKKYEQFSIKTDISDIIALSGENKNHGLTFTPVFLINNYQFPVKYDNQDVFYFVDEILEDEDILNEKV